MGHARITGGYTNGELMTGTQISNALMVEGAR